MTAAARYALEGALTGTIDTDSHTAVIAMVGRDKRVLETGCANGFTSRHLAANGCRVVGVELDPELAKEAEQFCERVVVADLDTVDLASAVEDERFDVVVFADVLEHLKRPLDVLHQARSRLEADGCVVASIPNIAHGAVRLALLQGRFEYRPLGLLDDTHIKFFTAQSIEALFHDAGMEITQMHRIQADPFATEIPLDKAAFAPEVLAAIADDPEARTYQFLIKAVIGEGNEAVRQLHEREELQRLDLARTRAERDRLREELDALRRDADGEMTGLRAALDQARAQRATGEAELARLVRAVQLARTEAAAAEDEIARLRATATYRSTRALRRLYAALRRSTAVVA